MCSSCVHEIFAIEKLLTHLKVDAPEDNLSRYQTPPPVMLIDLATPSPLIYFMSSPSSALCLTFALLVDMLAL